MTDLFSQPQPRAPQAPQPERSRAASRNNPAARRRRKQRRTRLAIVLVASLAVVGGAGYFLAGRLPDMFTTEKAPVDFAGPGTGEVLVKVPRGASSSAIGSALVEAGVVKSQDAFADALSAHANAQGKAAVLNYGTYSLKEGMTAKDALAAMLDRKNLKQDGVTVIEGRWVSETFERLSSVTGIPVADFEKAAKKPEDLGLPEVAKGEIEGWLAPATYPFESDTTAVDLLSTMIAKQKTVLDDLGIGMADAQKVLTIASIVEAEAPAKERGKIARVIENRLDQGWKLDMDSTVNFLVGKRPSDMGLTKAELATDSPYNTRRFAGLPPGPIGSPGKAAIEAALDPTPGDWMFFVTVNGETGETKYSTTNTQHNLYKAEFQAWQKDYNERMAKKDQEKEGSE
ncbi:endolytic transglycosylase MltG [Sanguibacter sp. HDW7]|uniref:endolytic transglycosylase MltG n=1 Tax=Sanguibacter sp. HDW7 TaxID=2714931 RepID=UPI00140B64CB|nr:endolytic transglycosylase MltG [Sanguibacter sp. HDW7]QIK83587.1 endolytic transglycosylase MltG [Sanguibacter sp. HDW7]